MGRRLVPVLEAGTPDHGRAFVCTLFRRGVRLKGAQPYRKALHSLLSSGYAYTKLRRDSRWAWLEHRASTPGGAHISIVLRQAILHLAMHHWPDVRRLIESDRKATAAQVLSLLPPPSPPPPPHPSPPLSPPSPPPPPPDCGRADSQSLRHQFVTCADVVGCGVRALHHRCAHRLVVPGDELEVPFFETDDAEGQSTVVHAGVVTHVHVNTAVVRYADGETRSLHLGNDYWRLKPRN